MEQGKYSPNRRFAMTEFVASNKLLLLVADRIFVEIVAELELDLEFDALSSSARQDAPFLFPGLRNELKYPLVGWKRVKCVLREGIFIGTQLLVTRANTTNPIINVAEDSSAFLCRDLEEEEEEEGSIAFNVRSKREKKEVKKEERNATKAFPALPLSATTRPSRSFLDRTPTS